MCFFVFFISRSVPGIFAIKVQSCPKSRWILHVFHAIFCVRAPKSLYPNFYFSFAAHRVDKFGEDIQITVKIVKTEIKNCKNCLCAYKICNKKSPANTKVNALAPFLTESPVWQTDGRTDGRTELRWLGRATTVAAVARKNVLANIAFFYMFWSWLTQDISYITKSLFFH